MGEKKPHLAICVCLAVIPTIIWLQQFPVKQSNGSALRLREVRRERPTIPRRNNIAEAGRPLYSGAEWTCGNGQLCAMAPDGFVLWQQAVGGRSSQ